MIEILDFGIIINILNLGSLILKTKTNIDIGQKSLNNCYNNKIDSWWHFLGHYVCGERNS